MEGCLSSSYLIWKRSKECVVICPLFWAKEPRLVLGFFQFFLIIPEVHTCILILIVRLLKGKIRSLYQNPRLNTLYWPKSSFGFLHNILWKNLKEPFGQLNICINIDIHHTYTYWYMDVYMHINMQIKSIPRHVWVCLYVCIHMCMCIHKLTHIYTHTHMSLPINICSGAWYSKIF